MSAYENRYWWSNDGLRLHYRDYPGGEGRPPIICIPGLTRNARDFEQLAERLAGRWRVMCVEMRGRGESAYAKDPLTYVPLVYLQDIEAMLREAGIDRFVAIGTSLGGLMAMLLASTRPGRVCGALLNDVGPELNPAGLDRIRTYVGQGRTFSTWMHAARATKEMHGEVYPNFDTNDWLTLSKQLMKLSPGGRIAFDYDMRIAEPFLVPGGETGVDLWPAFNALKSIPVTVLRGENSDVLGSDAAQNMIDKLEDGELVTITQTGHAPTLGEPEAQAAIDRLLERVASS